MRRVVATLAAVGLIPIVAWASASAEPGTAVDCTSPTTAPGAATCVSPAPAEAVEPVTEVSPPTPPPAPAPPTPPTTVAPEGAESTDLTTTTTTTAVPPTEVPTSVPDSGAPTTTSAAPETSTTTPAATTTSTTTTTTTTVVDPNATTTTDPNAMTTTTVPATVDPNATTTTTVPATVDPNATTTTTIAPAAPADDIETAPVQPPVEAPSGQIVVPNGTFNAGQARAITFPVAGPVSYVDDFGACRDNCTRFHKGNDVIGDRLQPLLAMHDGVIDHLIINHPTAGFGVAIRDDDGWRYDTYHMNNDTPGTDDGADNGTWRFLPGIVAGARVVAGQQIGWMGDSGNAEGSVPHVHVEIHTPDGQPVDPFWSLRAAQQAVNCAVGTVGAPLPVTPTTTPADGAATTTPATSEPAPPARALAGQADDTTSSTPALAMTTKSDAEAAADWLTSGWTAAALPAGWWPFTVTGGHPGSGQVAGKFWISPQGYTPVDAPAARVGDPRYDVGVDCAQPSVAAPSTSIPAALGAILATIRAMETGGDYSTTVTSSTASGAYAFIDGSWGGYGGYPRAKDAPPAVQDAKAAEYASYILQKNNGDVSTIPVSWYIGHVPVGAEWDTVPAVGANKLTPRQYQDRWMRKYAQLVGDPGAWVTGQHESGPPQAADTSASCHTVVIDVGDGDTPQYALTQAHSFLVDADGRAVPNAQDPCDPGRVLDAAPPAPPAGPDSQSPDTLATLVAPIVITSSGPR